MALTFLHASGATIAITNGNFENPATTVGQNNNTITGWTEEAGGSNSFITNPDGDWAPAGATQVGYFSNNASTAINQTLIWNWSATDQYTLSLDAFDAGWRATTAGDALGVQLREADGTVLWDSGSFSLDGTVTGNQTVQGSFSWGSTSRGHTWNIDATGFASVSGAVAGSALNLRIYRVSGVAFFDNISLAVSPVPEPSHYGVLGAGALAMLTFMRKRRNRSK